MFYYRIAGVTLASCYRLPSFKVFICETTDADVTLEKTEEQPPRGQDFISGRIAVRRLADGWFYHAPQTAQSGLYVSSDYTRLRMLGEDSEADARWSRFLKSSAGSSREWVVGG